MHPAPALPQDMWNEIIAFLQEEETLLAMTQVSKGTQNTAEKELTRRWIEQGFLLATGPKELTAALADPDARVIITRGGTVDAEPASRDAHVIAAGPVAVTGGTALVRDSIGTITGVTDGHVRASGAAQVSNVSGGDVAAFDSVRITGVSGGYVGAYESTQVSNVTDGWVGASGAAQVSNVSGGTVYAGGTVQVTNVSAGTVYARDDVRVSATGGVIYAYHRASVHSEGAEVHVDSADAMITATGGAIHLHVPHPKIIYSGDVTFYDHFGGQIDPPTAFGE